MVHIVITDSLFFLVCFPPKIYSNLLISFQPIPCSEDDIEDIQKVVVSPCALYLILGYHRINLTCIGMKSSFPKRLYFLLQEISVLSQCRCPYITDYYGSYLHQTKLWIVMEYMAGGSVADLVCFVYPLSIDPAQCFIQCR